MKLDQQRRLRLQDGRKFANQVRLDPPRLFPADATAPSIHGSFLETISLLGAAFTAEMWPYSWFGDCHAQSVAIKKILPVRTEAAYCRI
jgi:hypothetical protein